MADLTNDVTLESPSEGQAAPASGKSQTDKKQDTAKVNLHEFEDFRKYQAERDRREAQLNQQLQQQNAYMAQLQKQMDQLADKDLDDYGKLQKQIEREQRDKAILLDRIRQQEEAQREQQAKHSDLTKLTTKFGLTNEQYQELWKANNPDDALDMAISFRDRNKSKRDEDEEERRESNRVDVGGGAASTSKTRKESDTRRAIDENDPVAFIRSIREQNRRK